MSRSKLERLELEPVKAMLFEAFKGSLTHGVVKQHGRYDLFVFANPNHVRGACLPSTGLNADKLAATVAKWFAARGSAG